MLRSGSGVARSQARCAGVMLSAKLSTRDTPVGSHLRWSVSGFLAEDWQLTNQLR